MRLVKRLAHRREGIQRPQQTKRLFFSSMTLPLVLLATGISTCCMANRPATVNARPNEFSTYKEEPCTPDINQLQDGEIVEETRCLKDKKFILTNTSLLVIDKNRQKGAAVEVNSRTDIRKILERGLVAWAQSDDTVYFLTKDRELTLIPLTDMGDTVSVYEMPFDINNAKMAYFNKMLYIGPVAGEIVRLSFSGDINLATMPLSLNAKNPDFFVLGNVLFFGEKKGEKVEITKE